MAGLTWRQRVDVLVFAAALVRVSRDRKPADAVTSAADTGG